MVKNDWKQQETVIAVAGDKQGEWKYSTYRNWDEAVLAIRAVRKQGKAAVVFDGASPPVPPEF